VERHYFDHNATTPVSSEVMEAMLPCFAEAYGNASSIHGFGQEAKRRLEHARRQIAAALGCDAAEVVFLSGGTEADNLAILGVGAKHVVTTTFEHPAVLVACARCDATYVPVGPDGIVDPDDIRRALRAETGLVSVMHANNELGTVQPIAEIARIAHQAGALFHSDGVQAMGKIAVNLTGIDLYSLTGHKFYAPKGAGALMARKRVKLAPRSFGGHHERDRRAGTENVPGAVGLGRAAEWACTNLAAESVRLCTLRDRLENSILDRIPRTAVNGHKTARTPNTTNIRFDGIDSEALVIALDLEGFAVSGGAACSSGASEPSHVLTAIGLTRGQARSSLRFSLGRQNTGEEVDALVEAVVAAVEHLRRISPQ
jgi:cysteine desulfurase